MPPYARKKNRYRRYRNVKYAVQGYTSSMDFGGVTNVVKGEMKMELSGKMTINAKTDDKGCNVRIKADDDGVLYTLLSLFVVDSLLSTFEKRYSGTPKKQDCVAFGGMLLNEIKNHKWSCEGSDE